MDTKSGKEKEYLKRLIEMNMNYDFDNVNVKLNHPYQLTVENYLHDSEYIYFWALINKKGFKQLEPLDEDIKLHKPNKINSLLNLLFEKRVLQKGELLEMFKVNPEFFQNLLRLNANVFYKFMTINHQSQKEQIINSIVTIVKKSTVER